MPIGAACGHIVPELSRSGRAVRDIRTFRRQGGRAGDDGHRGRVPEPKDRWRSFRGTSSVWTPARLPITKGADSRRAMANLAPPVEWQVLMGLQDDPEAWIDSPSRWGPDHLEGHHVAPRRPPAAIPSRHPAVNVPAATGHRRPATRRGNSEASEPFSG